MDFEYRKNDWTVEENENGCWVTNPRLDETFSDMSFEAVYENLVVTLNDKLQETQMLLRQLYEIKQASCQHS